MNCPNCGVPLMGGMIICPKCKFDTKTTDGGQSFRDYSEQADGGQSFRVYSERLIKEADNKAKRLEEKIRLGDIDAIRDDLRQKMVLSTCMTIEGRTIKRQCGLVFGEVAFKTGFFKSLGASISDLVDTLSLGDKELSGTSELLEAARTYAITKMKDSAINRGANAIIGIDAESSFGHDIMHVSIYGTAVELE